MSPLQPDYKLRESLRILATASDTAILNFQSFSTDGLPPLEPFLFNKEEAIKYRPVVFDNITYFIEIGENHVTTFGVKASFDQFLPNRTAIINEGSVEEVLRRGIVNDSCCMIIPPELGGKANIVNLHPIRENFEAPGNFLLYKSLIAIISVWLTNEKNKNANPLVSFQVAFEFSKEHKQRPVIFKYALQLYSQTTSNNETIPDVISSFLRSFLSLEYVTSLGLEKPKDSNKIRYVKKATDYLPTVSGVKGVASGIRKIKNEGILSGIQSVALGITEILFDLQTVGLFSALRLGKTAGMKGLTFFLGKGMLKSIKSRIDNSQQCDDQISKFRIFLSTTECIINMASTNFKAKLKK